MKRWFDSFEVTIEPGGIHPLRMSGRIVRILDIENGEEVHAKVDGSAWARMEEGTTSPDTIEVFNTLQLWNKSDTEITVKGRILYGEDKDDRKKLIGAVKIDDTAPVSVFEYGEFRRKALVTGGTSIAFDQTRKAFVFACEKGSYKIYKTDGGSTLFNIYEGERIRFKPFDADISIVPKVSGSEMCVLEEF